MRRTKVGSCRRDRMSSVTLRCRTTLAQINVVTVALRKNIGLGPKAPALYTNGRATSEPVPLPWDARRTLGYRLGVEGLAGTPLFPDAWRLPASLAPWTWWKWKKHHHGFARHSPQPDFLP